MVVLGVILLGIISYDKLGVDLFPDLNNPRIFVEIKAGERPPEEIEQQYVKNMEALAIRQKDVLQVSSITRVGSAQITVEYAWNKDMDEAFLDLQKALNAFNQRANLDEMLITQHDPNTAPVVLVAMTHSRITDMNELRKVSENYIRNELVRLEGVAEVELSGEEESEVIINTNEYLLKAFQLTLDEVSQKIKKNNTTVSGGKVTEMGTQYIVKGLNLLEEKQDFENLIVGYRKVDAAKNGTANTSEGTKAPIYLRDVATVTFANKEPLNIVRINGERCVGLSIYKETRYNTVKAVEQITKELTGIEKALPGYHFHMISNQGTFIGEAVGEVGETAIIGIVLAIFVLFIFLRRIGTTFIVSIAIPISIIATFNLMYFNDLTLNIMTLGGLALGAGMLVDNAIVVIENIFRNHENGMSVRDAAIKGTAEVGGAITASTLTTIVVFLPIVYLHGASGELFKDQAWTVAFSLLSSLLVAIFLIPMLYHRIYKKKPAPVKAQSVNVTGYGRFLGNILNRRWLIIFIGAALVGAAVLAVPYVGTEFMPKSESLEFKIEMKMAEGTELYRTANAAENIETLVKDLLKENLDKVYSHVGPTNGLSGSQNSVFEGENNASFKVLLKPETTMSAASAIAVLDKATSNIPGVELSFNQEQTALNAILGTDEAPVVVEVKGEELKEIEKITQQVQQRMNKIAGIFNVKTSIENGAPEVEVVVDRLKAGIHNVDINAIITQVKAQLEGKEAGQMEREGEMRDITLKLPQKSLADIANMSIKAGTQEFRLSELAEIKHSVSPKEIYRRNQSRIGKVMAQVNKGVTLEHVAKEIRLAVADIDLPANYSIKVTGEEEKRAESMHNLLFAMLLSIVLVYMVMASQFESLIHPFTILLTIPLAVVGAIFIFLFMGQTLNMMAIIGIIMLVGIAVNDSIILVDRINQLKAAGLGRTLAIIEAGQQRIRPIMMTSLTTILALLPLTIGFGQSASLRSPMALAVIGGLVTSTLLTLVVIPCVYDVFDRLKDLIVGKKEE